MVHVGVQIQIHTSVVQIRAAVYKRDKLDYLQGIVNSAFSICYLCVNCGELQNSFVNVRSLTV